MSFSTLTFSKLNFEKHFGRSKQAEYIFRYLTDLKCETIIIERNYIDKDYLIDYSNYYSRSFSKIERLVNRVHFFNIKISRQRFKKWLCENNHNSLQEAYLGFSIVRPITDDESNFYIGRTLLKTYCRDQSSNIRHFLKGKCSANLYGIDLEIETLPFQAQDSTVGGCATVALWITQYPLNWLFGVKIAAPSDITKHATKFPALSKRNPSTGLFMDQMLHYLNSIDVDVDVIHVSNYFEYKTPNGSIDVSYTAEPENVTIANLAIMAFQRIGIPIIAAMAIKNEGEWRHHVAVISGYKSNNKHELMEFYVHDDQIGPYSRTSWYDSTIRTETGPKLVKQVKSDWTIKYGCQECAIQYLIIPEYLKIRTLFSALFLEYNKLKKEMDNVGNLVDLLLYDINEYKKEIASKKINNKLKILTYQLPKYFFVFRIFDDTREYGDMIFDATALNTKKPSPIIRFPYEY